MSERAADSIRLKLGGRIDADNSETVQQALLSELEERNPASVVLDADELSYISSAGLRMLLQIIKKYPDLSIINVHQEVYEILEMTGFTELLTVEKALRVISVEGCEVIGEGANGKVYRVDRETVVKTYKNEDSLQEIMHEQSVARLALILGIPTAISYDVVRVGDGYGSVFELLDARSFSNILADQPEKTDWCVREFVSLLKRIHSTAVPEGKLPSANKKAKKWVSRMKACLPAKQGEKLQEMINAVPEPGTMIHGDYHTKNVVLSGGEVLLIDMDTLSTGHPLFELAQMYCSFIGFSELVPDHVKSFQGIDADTAKMFWKKSLKAYFDTEDDEEIIGIENKIRCAAYARLIDWSMRHRKQDDEEGLAERKLWLQELTTLLARTDTLLFENDKADEMPEPGKGKAKTKEELSVCERILRSGRVLKTDLHMHTTVSDGTDTPEKLLELVRKAGIPLFSTTDHDSVKSCRIISGLRREGDPDYITGAEFSCRDNEGKYHILGYGFDPDLPSIKKLVEIGHANRISKTRARLEYLRKEFGIRIPDAAIRKLYEMDNPGKPHLGLLMVKYGFAASKEEAISNFLDMIQFTDEYLRPEDAIIGILGAGGIPVLAHPILGSGQEYIVGEALEKRLKKLMGYGLGGLEAFYAGFSGQQRTELLTLAEKYGLYVTAGSDYHGKNKRVILGNTGMDSATELPDGFRRFLKDVNYA